MRKQKMKILDFALRPIDVINEKLLCVHVNFFGKKFVLTAVTFETKQH